MPTATFGVDEFTIVDIYRYEGNTDPADNASVYVIESASGLMSILVTGYDAFIDALCTAILEKLRRP